MDDMHTMVRTQLAVNNGVFHLAQGLDVEELKRQIEVAAQTAATFVEFVVVGNRSVSVLISSYSQVVLSTETVLYDPRDTGDDDVPFGGFFDF